ncbi:hypothetical protein PG988_004407 [Apiospora saccharicola]
MQPEKPGPDPGSVSAEDNDNNNNNNPLPELQTRQPPPPPPDPNIKLLSSPLYRLSISRHIRTIYTPTVTHLRAYLAVFSPTVSTNILPPPSTFRSPTTRKPPHLILYGLVALHRDTSEWSAQGLGTTCAAVAETGRRLGWRAEVADPPPPPLSPYQHSQVDYDDGDEQQPLRDETRDDGKGSRVSGKEALQRLLREKVPMLSGGVALRPGLFDADEGGAWSGRAVEVGRVLSRWCDFGKGEWDEQLEDKEV